MSKSERREKREKRKRDWARHRDKITELYWVKNMKAQKVREIMKKDYGFDEEEKAYKNRFKQWGLKKNVSAEDSKRLLGIEKRRALENKATLFKRHPGSNDPRFKHHHRLVKAGNLRRSKHRHKRNIDPNFSPDIRATTPPNFTYGTPEPDMLRYSLAPGSGQELSVEDQASMGDTSESHYFDGDGSSQAGTVPWEASPGPFSGFSADPYSGTEQAAQTHMAADFQGLSSGHQQSYGSHDFVQPNTQSWVGPTETPSHPYHASGYGTSWAQPPQPLQQAMHSLDPSPTALVFPNHYNPNLDYGVINTAPFHNAIPSRTTIGIPEATSSDLEYMPLHRAVVSSDIRSATALLRNRANPNTAAQGGATPLHSAAYRRAM